MKNKALKKRVIAYNKAINKNKDKAGDLDIIIAEVFKLPYGQLKKVLTPAVMDVLAKYGYVEDSEDA